MLLGMVPVFVELWNCGSVAIYCLFNSGSDGIVASYCLFSSEN